MSEGSLLDGSWEGEVEKISSSSLLSAAGTEWEDVGVEDEEGPTELCVEGEEGSGVDMIVGCEKGDYHGTSTPTQPTHNIGVRLLSKLIRISIIRIIGGPVQDMEK